MEEVMTDPRPALVIEKEGGGRLNIIMIFSVETYRNGVALVGALDDVGRVFNQPGRGATVKPPGANQRADGRVDLADSEFRFFPPEVAREQSPGTGN